jgi:ligand-binding sensor domain-containing protein
MFAGFAVSGHALDPSQPASSYLRSRFATEDGLPSAVVHDIVQTKEGFLWLAVGTHTLTRFDGRHFTDFTLPFARVLAVGPDGDLWTGTEEGLERIPAAALDQSGRLPSTSYRPGPGAASQIICLHFSRNGTLWVGTHEGLYRFDQGGFFLIVPQLQILRIEESSKGHLLLVTSQGFLEWDGGKVTPESEIRLQLGTNAGLLFHVMEDSRGVTWFCSSSGVARRFRGGIERIQSFGRRGDGAVRAYEDPQGNIWVARAEGLFRITAAGQELVAPGMNVRMIYGDRDGDLWIGTNGDGLIRFKDRTVRMFTTSEGLPNNVVMTVLAAHDGKLWTGCNCGGVSWFDGRRFHAYNEKDGLLNSCIFSLAEDANHDLWIGTYGGGVFRFRDGHFTQYSKAQGLASNIASSIVAARDGSLWIATPEAVTRIKNGRVRNYTEADGLSANNATKIYEDRDGGIWVGTHRGIDRLAGNRFVSIPSTMKTVAWPLGGDRSGGIYATMTTTGGIFRIENDRPILVSQGIQVTDMLEAQQGDLWLTGIGIFRVWPGGFNRRPHDEPQDYAMFGRPDGLNATQWQLWLPHLGAHA